MSHTLFNPAAGRRLLACAAALFFTTIAFSADAPAPRLNPDGIDGALLLTGDKAPDHAIAVFAETAGLGKAALVIVYGDDRGDRETAEKLVDALKTQKPASVAALSGDFKDPKLHESLRAASGVWLVGGAAASAFRDSEAGKEVRAAMKRGVAAVSGAPADAPGLLPGAVIDAQFRADGGVEKMFAALDKAPGAFGIGLGEGAALLIRGRRMTSSGDGPVTVFLPKSPIKPRRVLEVTAEAPSDLTMLRRAAIARAAEPFPPKEAPTPEVPTGSLVIVGGGGMPADVVKKFIDLAGGKDAHFVVLPTANPGGGNPEAEGAFLRRAGANNVVSLPATKLEEVEDPKNLEVLRKADAVWFGGGRQWHFVDVYEGTKAYDLFHDVLRRGGVIGGSSAGATIQGDYLCRGSPLNNTDEMCEGYERGFAFLPGVAIDQHFAQRKRFADMTGLKKAYPQLLGVGLDEATAIVVTGHEAAVVGKGEAHFYGRGEPPAADQPDYEAVKAGGRYDLKARKVLDAGGGQ